uniref:Uncharacterized protein n=1 Tax=Arundo donax TaxID=35708 RepID=A0A0A9DJZ2_ARUDO
MRSATLIALAMSSLTIGFIDTLPGIHLSFHTSIEDPSPIRLIIPFCSTSLPCKMAFHVTELFFLLVVDNKLP